MLLQVWMEVEEEAKETRDEHGADQYPVGVGCLFLLEVKTYLNKFVAQVFVACLDYGVGFIFNAASIFATGVFLHVSEKAVEDAFGNCAVHVVDLAFCSDINAVYTWIP